MVSESDAKLTIDVNGLVAAIGRAADARAAMQLAVERLKTERPHYTWVGIYLLEGQELVLGSFLGKPSPHTRISLNRGICGAAASQQQTIIVDDVNSDPRYLACSLETKSEIVVPIMRDGQVLGEIDIDSDRPAAFVIDTGGQAFSISRTAAVGLEQLGRFRRIPLRVYGSSGWDRDAFLLPGVDLEVDDVRMAQTSLVVLNLRAPSVLLGYELGGILGHKFLSKYRVSLDIDEGLMRLDD